MTALQKIAALQAGRHGVPLPNHCHERTNGMSNINSTEVWKPVVGYEGFYEVSNLGRIKSIDRFDCKGVYRSGKVLAMLIDRRTGYLRVTLSKHGVSKKWTFHVLVLTAFCGARPSSKHHACHWDGDRANGSLANLRWGTAKENAKDKIRHGTKVYGETVGTSILTKDSVEWILESPLTTTKIASMLGVARQTVSAIRLRVNWAHVKPKGIPYPHQQEQA